MFVRGNSGSSCTLKLTECNRSRLMSLKFPFAIILNCTIVAVGRCLRNNK